MRTEQHTIQSLQADLAQANSKIAELEKALQPLVQHDNLTYRIQDTLLEDIGNLLSLINSTEDLIWFVDRNKRMLLANEATIAEFKQEQGIEIEPGMLTADFLPEDLAHYYDKIFETALRGKTLRLNHTGTNKKEYSATIQPVEKDGKIIGASVFARDITKIHQLQKELRQHEQIIASTPNWVALLDKDYNFRMVNDAYLNAFRKKREDLLGTNIRSLLGERHFKKHTEPHLIKAFNGEIVYFDVWINLPDKSRRFMSVTYHPLHSQKSKPQYIAVNAQDITALKKAEGDRQKIFEFSLDMLCVLDFAGRFEEINPAWSRTLGWQMEELKGQSWLDIVIPEDRDDSINISKRLSKGESIVGFENRCRCKNGSFKWLAWSSYPDLKQQQIFSAVRDITNRKQMEEELLQLATTDPLTGASNRRHFIERASTELKRSRRYGSQMAIIMLDIDHFKQVNDNYGHSIGDEVLKRLVNCCQQELRSSDIFGRFGGEEFAIILVETDQQKTSQTCERLIEQISKLKIRTPRGQISVTVSIGVTMQLADDISIDSLLKRADDALYKAKNAGRNRAVAL
jgi:diguanylate cyclase (GGDEF)-like protein/PAS domain S-box-containing protein